MKGKKTMKKNHFLKKFNKLPRVAIALLLTFITIISIFSDTYFVKAQGTKPEIETTEPLYELTQDASFDINNYPANKNGQIQLLRLYEYCYSFYEKDSEKYALYLYLYNPTKKEIKESALNKVQMSIKKTIGIDDTVNYVDYNKYNLKVISYSDDYLFYKLKVLDNRINNLTLYNRIPKNQDNYARNYAISGIEILQKNGINAVEYLVNSVYTYTGFSKGYAPKFNIDNSNLKCYQERLESITLDVNHTVYRTNNSNKGANYQNQIDTVYFTVPNRFKRDYGNLQRIKAEWYEYKTKDIIVTSNTNFYNKLMGKDGTPNKIGWNFPNYSGTAGWALTENMESDTLGIISETYADFNWNMKDIDHCQRTITALYYLFYNPNLSGYSPDTDYLDVDVSVDKLSNWIYNYNYSHSDKSIALKNGKNVWADLFENDIDSYRKVDNEYGKIQQGYSYYDFDADIDIFNINSYNAEDHSLSENAKMVGLWNAIWGNYEEIKNQTRTDIKPIEILEDNSLIGTNSAIANNLLINTNDVQKIKNLYNQAKLNDESVVLFRFANSDYYRSYLTLWDLSKDNLGLINFGKQDQAYRAQQSVFLDFDVIQLTFSQDGEMTVVPVVSNPQDIINPVSPPQSQPKGFWDIVKNIIAWILTIVFIVALSFYGFGVYKLIISILDLNKHIVVTIILMIPILLVTLFICIKILPIMIGVIRSLGGL